MIPVVPPVQKHPAALPAAGHRRDAKFHRATIARFRLCDAGKPGAVGVRRLNLLKSAPSRNAQDDAELGIEAFPEFILVKDD